MRRSRVASVTAVNLEPEESFHRAFKFTEFDVTEISMSSYTMTTARGDAHYVAIPAFVSRLFRHSSIYIRTDRGIASPQDLKGKTIGLPEYQMTANVWVRGILQDEYGVKPSDIKWRRGGLEEAGREERARITLPAGDRAAVQVPQRPHAVADAGGGRNRWPGVGARAELLPRAACPRSTRLFPDYPAVEAAYFRKTRIFPIMHAIGIRRSLVETHPWLAVSVYKAFLKAKQICMAELGQIGHLAVSLPWCVVRLRARARGAGRGLLELRRQREPPCARQARRLLVRPGPVGAQARGSTRCSCRRPMI